MSGDVRGTTVEVDGSTYVYVARLDFRKGAWWQDVRDLCERVSDDYLLIETLPSGSVGIYRKLYGGNIG